MTLRARSPLMDGQTLTGTLMWDAHCGWLVVLDCGFTVGLIAALADCELLDSLISGALPVRICRTTSKDS